MPVVIEMPPEALQAGEFVWMADRTQKKNTIQASGQDPHISKALQDHITIAVNAAVKEAMKEFRSEFKELKIELEKAIEKSFAVESAKLRAESARRDWIALVSVAFAMLVAFSGAMYYVINSELKPINLDLVGIKSEIRELKDAKKTSDLRNGPPTEASDRQTYAAEMKSFIQKSIERHVPPPIEAIKGFVSSVKLESLGQKDAIWELLPLVARYANSSQPEDSNGWQPMISEDFEEFKRWAASDPSFKDMKFYERNNSLLPGIAYNRNLDGSGRLSVAKASEAKIVGGGTTLDGMEFKNTTFEKVRIVYRGGPLSLINVRFINCEFILPNRTPRTLQTWASIVEQIPNRVSSEGAPEGKRPNNRPPV